MTDNDGTDCEEAPCDGDVVIPGVVTSNVGTLCQSKAKTL
jgi:hypothetical protein